MGAREQSRHTSADILDAFRGLVEWSGYRGSFHRVNQQSDWVGEGMKSTRKKDKPRWPDGLPVLRQLTQPRPHAMDIEIVGYP